MSYTACIVVCWRSCVVVCVLCCAAAQHNIVMSDDVNNTVWAFVTWKRVASKQCMWYQGLCYHALCRLLKHPRH
jgi:hypothetical protein